jgi:Protein of unknown function (DUF2844)
LMVAGMMTMGGAAWAGLGGDTSSIDSDMAALGAKPVAQQFAAAASQSYSAKSFVTAQNVTVHEYINPDGKVFGVAWAGPRPPDLSTILGERFDDYKTAAAKAMSQKPVQLHHSSVKGADSVVMRAGHMGFSTGRAWAPSLVPNGVDPSVVVK